MTMASATENVDKDYGGGLHFKAHVANYPICYGYNNPLLPYFPFGANAGNPLTGPVMIQIGENDDYDDGPGKCQELKDSLTPAEQDMVKVVTYEGAYHAWDRLMVPISGLDPFGHQGAGGTVRLIPSVDQAYDSRNRVVLFFLKNL
jgi:dienelactone hydrolase